MNALMIYLMDEIYEASRNEFNEIRTGTTYIICAEDNKGRRFFLTDSAISTDSTWEDEITAIKDKQAKRIAKIENHLAAGKHLNLKYWHEGEPSYGSQSWDAMDRQGYWKFLEERKAEFN